MEEILHQLIDGSSHYLVRVSTIQGGARFLPSTVCKLIIPLLKMASNSPQILHDRGWFTALRLGLAAIRFFAAPEPQENPDFTGPQPQDGEKWSKCISLSKHPEDPATFTSHFLQLTILSNPPDNVQTVVSCLFQDVADDVPTICRFPTFLYDWGVRKTIGCTGLACLQVTGSIGKNTLTVRLQPTNVCQNTLQLP